MVLNLYTSYVFFLLLLLYFQKETGSQYTSHILLLSIVSFYPCIGIYFQEIQEIIDSFLPFWKQVLLFFIGGITLLFMENSIQFIVACVFFFSVLSKTYYKTLFLASLISFILIPLFFLIGNIPLAKMLTKTTYLLFSFWMLWYTGKYIFHNILSHTFFKNILSFLQNSLSFLKHIFQELFSEWREGVLLKDLFVYFTLSFLISFFIPSLYFIPFSLVFLSLIWTLLYQIYRQTSLISLARIELHPLEGMILLFWFLRTFHKIILSIGTYTEFFIAIILFLFLQGIWYVFFKKSNW